MLIKFDEASGRLVHEGGILRNFTLVPCDHTAYVIKKVM
jgi:hypothetical protein